MSKWIQLNFLLLTVLCQPLSAETLTASGPVVYPDPQRFEKWIAAYLESDQISPPAAGAIVAVGSSSMFGWHETIKDDLAPLSIIPRGFGGSNMNDLLYYADPIVINYQPRAVIIYEGDNDIALGISPETILAVFNQVRTKIHAALPATRIYFLSIKPSISRWAMWPKMQEANLLLQSACDEDDRLTFIDIGSGMLGAEGAPIPDIFKADLLHMTDKGYRLWTEAVRPVLLGGELRYENQGND